MAGPKFGSPEWRKAHGLPASGKVPKGAGKKKSAAKKTTKKKGK